MSTISVGLSPEQFTAAFPFHVVCDAELRVVQAGPSLRRIFPQMCDGARLTEHFRSARPRGATTYAAICQQQQALFLLEPLAPGLTLRGQMLPLPESQLIAFLGAPSVTSVQQLSDSGLSLADFAIHDPIADLLTLLQAQQTALDEASQLATQLADQQAELALLDQVRTTLARELELEHLFHDVVHSIRNAFGYTLVSLYMRNEDALVLRAQIGYEDIPTRIAIDSGVTGQVARTGKPVLLEDVRSTPHFLSAIDGVMSELCVPLLDQGCCVGVLNVESIGVGLTQDDLRLMIALADQIGIAIGRARLYEAARESEATLRSFYDSTSFLMGVLELVDDDLVFVSANRSATRRFGRSQETIRGLPLTTWLSRDQLADWLEASRACLRSGEMVTFDYQRRLGDNLHWRRATLGLIAGHTGERPRFAYVVEDITERMQAEAALRASEQRFRLLFQHSPDGIVLIDPYHPQVSWPIVECNDTFCAMNGYAAAELIGQTIDVLHPTPGDLEERSAYLARLRREGSIHVETLHRRRDGTHLYIESLSSLVTIGGRELVLGIDRDVTRRKQAEAALAEARDQALEASRLKSEFLATVSHEIRTPMNGVIGMTELLLDTSLDDEQREFAQTINDSAQALLTIINDILDYSKIEAGKLILDRAELAVGEVLGSIGSLLGARARARGLELEISIDPSVPSRVRGDAGRLRQILLNLVGNAVKFTERGGIAIRVACVQSSALVTLRFEVTDTGIGIPEAALRQLFQPFSQADGSVTRRYGGTGLGLAISKRLAELMGGAIGCESAVGQGSTFWFTAQFGAVAAALQPETFHTPEPPTLESHATATARGRILLVEDHPVNQQLALRQIAKLGYAADVVVNGREAVEVIARAADDYQLVLMDCHMPVMDGFAASRGIRKLEQTRGGRIPIVAMTASALQSDRDACVAAGMDDFLSKPVRQNELRTTIARWMASAAELASSGLELLPGNLLDPAALAELRALDADESGLFADLVQTYLHESSIQLATLRAALKSSDAAALAFAAHQLRGSSANMGARLLADRCGQLEDASRAGALAPAGALTDQIEAVYAQVRAALQAEEAYAAR